MKYLKITTILYFLVLGNFAYSESINVAFNIWCPWMCDNLDKPGLVIELVENAFKNDGINVEFQKTSWSIGINEVREGRINGILAPAKVEAPDFIFSHEPVAYQQMCFYVKKSSKWNYKNTESLKDINIATIQGANYPGMSDYINKSHSDKKVKINQISAEDVFNAGFKLLGSNDVDTFVVDSITADYFLRTNFYTDQYKKVGCLKAENLYFALSPKNKEKSIRLMKIFDNSFETIKLSDNFQKLYDKYGIQKWEIKN